MARRIINELTRMGSGWTWTFVDEPRVLYQTNEFGDGIFRIVLADNSRKQLLGTCDFSLPSDEKSARRKILAWYRGE